MRITPLAGAMVGCLVVVLVGVAAGDQGDDGEPIGTFARTSSPKAPTAKCKDAILGRGFRPITGRDLIVGPVAFIGLVHRNEQKLADDRQFFERERGTRYTKLKAGASVNRGGVATIVVPRSERPELKIVYALGHGWASASTVEACPDRRTGFPGGFKVHGPLCTKLRVHVEGRSDPITKPISFGAGDCPAG
jgi:hypothetical protein